MAFDLFHKKSKTVTVAYKALPFSHHAPAWLPCYPKTRRPPSHLRNFALTFSLGMACSLTPFRLSPPPYQRGFFSAPCIIVNPTPAVTLYSPCPTLFSSVRHLSPLSILHILFVYYFSPHPKIKTPWGQEISFVHCCAWHSTWSQCTLDEYWSDDWIN